MENPGIYILSNVKNGKKYVGKDHNIPKRVNRHLTGNARECREIYNAIKKHNKKSFEVKFILYPGISIEALNSVEKWKINQLNTISPKGYNISKGGSGGFSGCTHSEKTKSKIAKTQSGKQLTEQHKLNISNTQKGRVFSEDTKEKLRKSWLPQNRKGHRKSVSESTRKKLSLAAQGYRSKAWIFQHEIKCMHNFGWSLRKLGKFYGCHYSTIKTIVNSKGK